MTTYRATFATGWTCVVKDETRAAASKRFAQTGRGESFTVAVVNSQSFNVFGKDADDDYEDGE